MITMTENEINTLENKAFRLECETFKWKMFRNAVSHFVEWKETIGEVSPEKWEELKKELEIIKYY